MGEIELKSLPKDMSAMAVNPGHLGRVPIDGCFKQQVKVQGEMREFLCLSAGKVWRAAALAWWWRPRPGRMA